MTAFDPLNARDKVPNSLRIKEYIHNSLNTCESRSKKFIPIRLRKTKFNPLSKGINAQFPKILGIALTRVKEKLNSLSVKEEAEYSLKPWESSGIQDREITDSNSHE